MSRTADYTIQGFLYQFNKTLLEILSSPDDAVITIEGIVEDIDIENCSMLTAIQCKYHETQKYTPGKIYKPLIQMMHHFYRHPEKNTKYILFAHFYAEGHLSKLPVTKETLEEALQSNDSRFASQLSDLRGNVDVDMFLENFSAPVGPPFDTLVQAVHDALKENGLSEDIDTLFYPNAIHIISALSSKHDVDSRKTTRKDFLEVLREIRKLTISRWTLASKTRRQILAAKRKELKLNLDKNARRRYFVFHINSLKEDDMASEVVLFAQEYCEKYHFKPTHIHPPVLCLETEKEEIFKDIQSRIHKKGIISTDGYSGNYFDEQYFLRQPMKRKKDRNTFDPEFSLRMLSWKHVSILNDHKADDLFILGESSHNDWDNQDVNIESLASQSIKEIKYILGISDVYE
jgi:hypothetical protein